MPWLSETMKDVLGCDKPRLGAKNRLLVDVRIGKPVLFIRTSKDDNPLN